MRGSLLHRSLAGIFAAWFVGVMVDSALMHSCPMHGIPGIQAEAAHHDSAPQPALDEAHAHDGHGAAATSGDEAPTESCCTCVGDCGVPPLAWTPLAGVVPVPDVAATADRGLPVHEYVAVAAAHVLPFANGPPTGA